MIPYKLTETCPKCNGGEVIRSVGQNIAYLSDPIQFPVSCDNPKCDYSGTRTEDKLYPKIIFDVAKKKLQPEMIYKTLGHVTEDDAIEIIKAGYEEFFITDADKWYLENDSTDVIQSHTLRNRAKEYHFTFIDNNIGIFNNDISDDEKFNMQMDNISDIKHQCYVKAYGLGYYIKDIFELINPTNNG